MKKKHSIVTKKGDKGYTYISFGNRLSKDDLTIEELGTMDELVSFLGMAKSLVKDKEGKSILERIQKDLFIVENQILGVDSKKLKPVSRRIRLLENTIKELEKKFKFKNFVLPGDNLVSSTLHVARAVARRLERRAAILKNKKDFNSAHITIYLNRLSDLLFLLACKYSAKNYRRC